MLEDDSGSMELIAFQRALDSGGAYLKENAALFIRGRISVRDEKEPQLMVDSIRPLAEAEAAAYQEPRPRERTARGGYAPRPEPAPAARPEQEKKLYLRLKSREDPMLGHIELLLTMFPGNQQLVIDMLRNSCREEGVALIIVTHSPQVSSQFDRVDRLTEINLVAKKKVDEIERQLHPAG